MPVPSTISDISDNASINSPAGTDQIAGTLDDYLRAIQAILKKQFITGGSIAASATLPVPAAGAFLEVTGSATIQQIANSFDGRCVILRFAAGSTLQHSSALIMPGGSSITTQANDAGVFVQTAAGTWTCAAFSRSLNADMVDGYHAGNASGQVAVSNGAVCTNLNADLLDGQHGAYYATAAAVATAQSTADGKASKAGDTFTGGLTFTSNTIAVGNSGGVSRGQLYNDASGIGLLNSGGGWAARVDYGTSNLTVAGGVYAASGTFGGWPAVKADGGTYSINIAGNAATASTAGSASTLGGASPSYYTDIPSRLGYTPVQQGTGAGQTNSVVKVGWSAGGLRLQVDSTDFATTWPININGNADTLDGYHAANFWRNEQASISLGATGHRKTPDGFIEQWGLVSAVPADSYRDVTFSTPFPSACVAVTLTAVRALSTGDSGQESVQNVTTSGFRLNNGYASCDYYYVAKGY